MEYAKPAYTADIVVFRPRSQETEILLIQRKNEPFKNCWALPGGFVEPHETGAQGALRELSEETGIVAEHLTPLGTFDTPNRDPRGWTISQAFYTYSAAEARAGDNAKACRFFNTQCLPELAFDHKLIIESALQKIAERWHYTQTQFDEATKKLKPIVAGIHSLCPHPKTQDCWEVSMICDFEGTSPEACARFKKGEDSVSLRVRLQDDGREPYAVCSLRKFLGMPTHHASHAGLEVENIYPTDHKEIPALVEWLLETEVPKPLSKAMFESIADYEKSAGFKTNDAFQDGWNAARQQMPS